MEFWRTHREVQLLVMCAEHTVLSAAHHVNRPVWAIIVGGVHNQGVFERCFLLRSSTHRVGQDWTDALAERKTSERHRSSPKLYGTRPQSMGDDGGGGERRGGHTNAHASIFHT